VHVIYIIRRENPLDPEEWAVDIHAEEIYSHATVEGLVFTTYTVFARSNTGIVGSNPT
jgi:hypothetical protein